jgi:CTP-dependent riboflavin kinase
LPFSIKGKVVRGKGTAAGFLGLAWVKDQIKEKAGFTPFMGTLNLELLSPSPEEYQCYIQSRTGIIIEPLENGCEPGLLFRAKVNNKVECLVVIPQIFDYPKNKVEVIAAVNLRTTLELGDGSMVSVSFSG